MNKHVFVVVLLLLTACSEKTPELFPLEVSTSEGTVAGAATNDTLSFKGVPYALPPVGELRWRAPQSPTQRKETLHTLEYQNRCYQRPVNPNFPPKQPEAYIQDESEDCLYLNIFRPAAEMQDLPVLFWIHGGGLVSGSGGRPVNNGSVLSQENIIVVTFNYRLGSFGFFAHPELSTKNEDEGLLFNYGLLDQIAALKWIKENIAHFGGNPNKITIAGESAGAASVNALLTSPLAVDLFQGAIIQSGYIRSPQPRIAALLDQHELGAETMGTALAKRLGNENATLQELRQTSAEDIVKATDFSSFIVFTVDGKSVVQESFAQLAQKKQHQVPLMIGTTDFEFGMVPPANQRQIMINAIGDEKVSALADIYKGEDIRDIMLYSDFVFHSQARAYATLHEQSGNPTFMYRFGITSGEVDVPESVKHLANGAYHANELPFMFGNFTGDHNEPTSPNQQLLDSSTMMRRYWANFVKHGSPNDSSLPEWKPFNLGATTRYA